MKKPTVSCGVCGGLGRVELSDVYTETLSILRKQHAPVNGAELARQARCTGVAL
jgi:hypothetical protein